jgi:dimethylsulfone monooxygenase
LSRPRTPLFNDNVLKLGLFSANCAGGLAITTVPERWMPNWQANLKLARMADAAGLEFLLPVARWTGYGNIGTSGYHDTVLETITWATGLLSKTEHINVVATVHTAFFHPVVAAKQFVTADHISDGRFGINIVCGWNRLEYEMFGLSLPKEHSVRYALGQEWLDIVKRIWTDEAAFDWSGDHFKLQHVAGQPKPFGGSPPPIMNAGSSGEGRAFAVRNADFLFTVVADIAQGARDVTKVKAAAAEIGRKLQVFTTAYIVCRPTAAEAGDYHEYYAKEHADWPIVERAMALNQLDAKSFPPEVFTLFRERFAGGFGTYPIIGDPDTVADMLAQISAAGFNGVAISFVNYTDEFPYFRDEVLPRLERKGLRRSVPT